MANNKLFGISLFNLFGKSNKDTTRKHKTITTKDKKNTKRKRARKRRTRKYKMKGGWGESSSTTYLPNISRMMNGGWGERNEIIL